MKGDRKLELAEGSVSREGKEGVLRCVLWLLFVRWILFELYTPCVLYFILLVY